MTNEDFIVNGFIISKTIIFYLFKKIKYGILKEYIIDPDVINKFSENYSIGFQTNKRKRVIKEFKKELYFGQYYSLEFWKSVNAFNLLKKHKTIDVGDNPFLFNAAACISYLNPSISVKFNDKNFIFPQDFTFELMKLVRYEIPLKDLLEFKATSIEVKNLCNLVYLSLLNQNSMSDLMTKYENSMNPRSLLIFILVYSNYTDESIPIQAFALAKYIKNYNSSDFLFLKVMMSFKSSNKFIFSFLPSFAFYILKSNDAKFFIKSLKPKVYNSKAVYSLFKTTSFRFVTFYWNFVRSNVNDFLRFMSKDKSKYSVNDRMMIYDTIIDDNPKSVDPVELVDFILDGIECKCYEGSYELLKKLPNSLEIISILKAPDNIKTIKKLFNSFSFNDTLKTTKKFDLMSSYTTDEKKDLYFASLKQNKTVEFLIDRKDILNDSMFCIKEHINKLIYVKIKFNNEGGFDQGGLSKDWFTCVSDEIIKSGIFQMGLH